MLENSTLKSLEALHIENVDLNQRIEKYQTNNNLRKRNEESDRPGRKDGGLMFISSQREGKPNQEGNK